MSTIARFVLALTLATIGCASAPHVEVEAVGQLTASGSHTYSQPVHATTDMTHSWAGVPAAASDDDGFTVEGR